MLDCLSSQASQIDRLVVVADVEDEELKEQVARVVAGSFKRTPTTVVESGGVGRAGARNAGVLMAGCDTLCFVDEDVLVAGDALERVHCRASDGIDVVTGEIYDLANLVMFEDPAACPLLASALIPETLRSRGFEPGEARIFRSSLQRAAALAFADPYRFRRVRFLGVVGAFLAVDRRVFQTTGGFDDDFGRSWGCEDLEFGWRLQESGASFARLKKAAFHMTHGRQDRLGEHEATLARFRGLHPSVEVNHLDALLGADGSVEAYLQAIGLL